MTRSSQMKFATCVTLVLLAIPNAYAGSTEATTQSGIEVNYSDLNLSSAQGLNALHQRLSQASREVCGSPTNLRQAGSIKQLRANKACFDRTLTRAIKNVEVTVDTQARVD